MPEDRNVMALVGMSFRKGGIIQPMRGDTREHHGDAGPEAIAIARVQVVHQAVENDEIGRPLGELLQQYGDQVVFDRRAQTAKLIESDRVELDWRRITSLIALRVMASCSMVEGASRSVACINSTRRAFGAACANAVSTPMATAIASASR